MSAIVVVRDGERYLAEALASMATQTRRPDEVIVIDDGSVDSSRQIARRHQPPPRVVAQRPVGIGAARNRGIDEAAGELIAFLDADDRWTPDSLECRLRTWHREPRPDVVWGLVRHFASPELASAQVQRLRCPPGVLPAHLPGGALISRSLFAKVGPFDGGLRVGEFIDWVARARELGAREATVDHVVLERRVHGANHTLGSGGDLSDLTAILRRAVRRRHQAAAQGP